MSLFVRRENYFYPFLARPPLFTKSVAIFWFRSFALNEQQASFFSGRQVVAATWCPPLSNKLAEIFDFSASLRRQAKHFDKPEAIKICSKLIYFLKIISTASKPHNIGSITTSSANAIFCVDDVITARFIKN